MERPAQYQPIENYGAIGDVPLLLWLGKWIIHCMCFPDFDWKKKKDKWGSLVDQIITTRVSYNEFRQALDFRSIDDIKTVIAWTDIHS